MQVINKVQCSTFYYLHKKTVHYYATYLYNVLDAKQPFIYQSCVHILGNNLTFEFLGGTKER